VLSTHTNSTCIIPLKQQVRLTRDPSAEMECKGCGAMAPSWPSHCSGAHPPINPSALQVRNIPLCCCCRCCCCCCCWCCCCCCWCCWCCCCCCCCWCCCCCRQTTERGNRGCLGVCIARSDWPTSTPSLPKLASWLKGLRPWAAVFAQDAEVIGMEGPVSEAGKTQSEKSFSANERGTNCQQLKHKGTSPYTLGADDLCICTHRIMHDYTLVDTNTYVDRGARKHALTNTVNA